MGCASSKPELGDTSVVKTREDDEISVELMLGDPGTPAKRGTEKLFLSPTKTEATPSIKGTPARSTVKNLPHDELLLEDSCEVLGEEVSEGIPRVQPRVSPDVAATHRSSSIYYERIHGTSPNTHTHTYIYIYILSLSLFPPRLPKMSRKRSPCSRMSPHLRHHDSAS